MNALIVGSEKEPILQHLPNDNFLLIDDGPLAEEIERSHLTARGFDVATDTFDPLKDIDHKRARQLASVLYAASEQPEATLTVRNGKRALASLLLHAKQLDTITGDKKDPAIAEALATIDDVLFSPVLERVLTRPANFSLTGTIIARLNRADLGDFDCFVLGNLLISQYAGTVIIPDFGFYAHKGHKSLIRQNRLIAGVNSFDEVPDFKSQLLMIGKKVPSQCTPDDAKTLALYEGLYPDPLREDSDYNKYLHRAIRPA